MAYLNYEDVKEYIGNPFDTPEDERLKNYNSKEHQPEPTMVYLGVDEATVPPPVDAPGRVIAEKYRGEAYFSIDVTPENQSEKYKKATEAIIEKAKEKGLDFLTVRIGVSLSEAEAPIVAMARSFTDWNLRNVVCSLLEWADCSIVLHVEDELVHSCLDYANIVSVWAGSKRTCPPLDLADGGKKSACISSKGIHNFAYPRTGTFST